MKSEVTKLYDYRSIRIPEEVLSGKIEDGEIAAQLEMLSRTHAKEEEAGTVQTGDSVACRGESDCFRWNRDLLLFYPGRGLCDGKLENACLGAGVGDVRCAETEEGAVKLTVLRIVRRSAAPVDDALVQKEGIPGVGTVEDFYRHYRSAHEPERKAQAVGQTVRMLLGKAIEKSEYEIDEEEAREWAGDQAKRQFQAMVDAGMDPCIPLQGTDFLTEEQAREQMQSEFRALYPGYLFCAAALEKEGLDLEAVFEEGMEKLAADSGMSAAALLEQAGPYRSRNIVYEMRFTDVLTAYVEQKMNL